MRRGRGRPRGSDSSDTRERIRKAAAKEFAAHGYDNASIRSIARAANVDPALVPRYFEDKAALFTAALDVPVRPDRIPRAVPPRRGPSLRPLRRANV